MKIPQKFWITVLLFVSTAIPSIASVIINAPANGSTVKSPFSLSAYTSLCSGQQVSTTGYSLDNSPDTRIFNAPAITTTVSAPTGGHTLHVKAWGVSGAHCVTDVAIIVSTSSIVPSSAASVSSIQTFGGWYSIHDGGTPGSSSGWSAVTSSPSRTGAARKFAMTYKYFGGQRYSISFGDDEAATNFILDTWIYLPAGDTGLKNLELDMNQVISTGATVLYGMQCDGWTGNWAYTANVGSASSPRPSWIKASGTSCNPRHWKQYTWHHVQASISRNNSGWVTYHAVWLDGVETQLNATVYAAANLGWGPAVTTQFQVDGYGSSGHVTAYLDHLKISMW